jgi:hypothetical protein
LWLAFSSQDGAEQASLVWSHVVISWFTACSLLFPGPYTDHWQHLAKILSLFSEDMGAAFVVGF